MSLFGYDKLQIQRKLREIYGICTILRFIFFFVKRHLYYCWADRMLMKRFDINNAIITFLFELFSYFFLWFPHSFFQYCIVFSLVWVWLCLCLCLVCGCYQFGIYCQPPDDCHPPDAAGAHPPPPDAAYPPDEEYPPDDGAACWVITWE